MTPIPQRGCSQEHEREREHERRHEAQFVTEQESAGTHGEKSRFLAGGSRLKQFDIVIIGLVDSQNEGDDVCEETDTTRQSEDDEPNAHIDRLDTQPIADTAAYACQPAVVG